MSSSDSNLSSARSVPPVSVFDVISDGLQINPLISSPTKPGILGTVDGFELLDVLSEGGMGIVFLARCAALPPSGLSFEPSTLNAEGLVALKILKPDLARQRRAVDYFMKEAQHMQRLSHPHILPVLAFKELSNGAYFVMPYMARGSLDRRFKSGEPLAEELILRIAIDLASALNYAHGRGIIHRDIKPRNILINAQNRACLTDFGLARSLLNDSLTDVRREVIEGTPQYLSPATARGEHEDTRGDIYSFGAVLYEMLTGQPPYSGRTRDEILRKIQTGLPSSIHQINPKASKSLTEIAERAMARSLAERYAHISYVLADLQNLRDGKRPTNFGILARAEVLPAWQRFLKRPLAAVLVMALVALVAIVGFLLWQQSTPALDPHQKSADAGDKNVGLRLWRQIELPGIWGWAGAQLQDWNGDGVPEFFLPLPNDKKFLIVSTSGQVEREWALPDPYGNDLRLHLTGPRSPILVSWRKGSQLFISALNAQLNEIKRFESRGRMIQTEAGLLPMSGITHVDLRDLAGDGKSSILAFLFTNWIDSEVSDATPRGLFCFDFETRKLQWNYLTAPAQTAIRYLDLDNDGVLDCLFGTDAVGNGATAADGTSDTNSYVCAVSSKGTPLWQPIKVGGLFTQATPLLADVDRDGREEIFVWVTGSHEQRKKQNLGEVGEVLRLGHNGQARARYNPGVRLMSCIGADIDGDGQSEIIGTDRQGNIHCLDRDLSLLNRANIVSNRFDLVELIIEAVQDLDHDGRPELVLSSMQQKIGEGMNEGDPKGGRNQRYFYDVGVMLLDASFRTIASYAVADEWKARLGISVWVADLDGDQRPEIMVFTDKAQALKFTSVKE